MNTYSISIFDLNAIFSDNGEEDEDSDDIGNEDLGQNDYEKVHDDPTDDTK